MRAPIGLVITILLAAATTPLYAQSTEIYVGPQLGLLGIGASAEVDFGVASVSGEFGFVPISSLDFTEDGIDYTVDTNFYGGLLLVNVYPTSSRFALSGGLLFGGYNADGEAVDLAGPVDVGDNVYDGADVGELLAEIDYGGVSPAVMIGLRGGGFNVGVGVALAGSPQFGLTATGPLQNDPQFVQDLEVEEGLVQDELDLVPVMPLFRIGWQFGVSK